MSTPILVTKLFIPSPRPGIVSRHRLIEQLNQGSNRKLTLISAPAGFGKTTLVSEWVANSDRSIAWLSLDGGDNDVKRFLSYVVLALQGVAPTLGSGVPGLLQLPQPPSTESILTTLLNEISVLPDKVILVLDDYHLIDAQAVDQALTFLLDNLPPQLHMAMTTREDPHVPVGRLRARGQLTELRAADLRFTASEAAEFLNSTMGLNLSAENIEALEIRTEGWIAGLQLAAISLQGQSESTGFIQSFTGSHRFVMDYLLEEVLHQQTESVQKFLLETSILDRFSGPLCDAVRGCLTASGQSTLDYLERANLFLVPLDNERGWYRYHHLFAELLRQRLLHRSASNKDNGEADVAELHRRASQWFEDGGMEIEALRHAAAANDIARAERLIAGKGVPLYARGGTRQVLDWLESLPAPTLETRPSLCVMFAAALSVAGQVTRIEPMLQAAEAAMKGVAEDVGTRDLIGRIAGMRSLVALLSGDPRQIETMIVQSRRALEHLSPDNIPVRAFSLWQLGLAHLYQKNRAEARQFFTESISDSEASGNIHVNILATTCLGNIQETDNQLQLATQTYGRALELVGEPPGPVACEAQVGLARINYEWNFLEAARTHGQLSVQLARQIEIPSVVSCELFLARLQLAQGDVPGAIASLDQIEQLVRQRKFWFRMPEVAAAQVLAMLRQGNLTGAADLAQTHDIPLSQARAALAQGNPANALALLQHSREQVEARDLKDELLKVMVLQALAHQANGDSDSATQVLTDVMVLAAPEEFIRLFVDEGLPMAQLVSAVASQGTLPEYTAKLMAALESEFPVSTQFTSVPVSAASPSLIDPLSSRELEVLHLISLGLSNYEISERLFLALSTVKGHNRVIFGKLDVQRRTEAVARARSLGII